jgi:hypothetical protein
MAIGMIVWARLCGILLNKETCLNQACASVKFQSIAIACFANTGRFLLVFLLLKLAPAHGQQLYKDKAGQQGVAAAAEALYNYDLDSAQFLLIKLAPKYAKHPGYLIFQTLLDFWRYMPIAQHPAEYARYKARMQEVVKVSEKLVEHDPADPEANFFAMLSLSMLGRQAAEEDESWAAVGYTRRAYVYMKRGFTMQNEYPEFYFSSGLYNYYRVRYPEDHPGYRPFLYFFPGGNKQLGIKYLESTAEQAIYTRTEALSFLCNIMLQYEQQPAGALGYSTQLIRRYSSNPYFRLVHAEVLLSVGKTADALPHLQMANGSKNPFYKSLAQGLYGLYLERISNVEGAQKAYQMCLNNTKGIPKMADNVRAHCFAGLARIHASKGNRKEARSYYQAMLHISQNSGLKKEARAYLHG